MLTGMTRTSGGRLIAAIIVGAVAVLPLSGCLYAQIPSDPVVVDDPVDPDPTDDQPTDDSGDPVAGDLPTALSFAEGAELPATAYIEWGDGFFTDDGWTVDQPDDGNGGWSYRTIDGTCLAQFWQGLITDVPVVDGDDSISSDAMLAVILGDATTADITPAATTGGFAYQSGGNTDVENRQITGQDGDRTWIMSARAFTATGVGVYVIVDCTGGDAAAVMAEVVDANAIVVTE